MRTENDVTCGLSHKVIPYTKNIQVSNGHSNVNNKTNLLGFMTFVKKIKVKNIKSQLVKSAPNGLS